MPNKWLPDETKTFPDDYVKNTNIDLTKIYPRHSFKSIEALAYRLGIKKDSSFKSETVSRTNKERKEVLDMDLRKVKTEELLEETSNRGFVSEKERVLQLQTYKFPRKFRPFKLGFVSDTHLGSQLQQITYLHAAYDIFEQEGVKDVLHTGDLIEGNGKQYRGQLYEMFLHGADKIKQYAIDNYPYKKGITTHVISGSHDYSYYKETGLNILTAIQEKRPDIHHLGFSGAYIHFGKIVVYLFHPSGGVPYARSYRMQKQIEQIPADEKPNILATGHLHITCELPMYRNVLGFQLPCFQAQTIYLKEKGYSPDLGFLIVEIVPDVKGIASHKEDWRPFYSPIGGDY